MRPLDAHGCSAEAVFKAHAILAREHKTSKPTSLRVCGGADAIDIRPYLRVCVCAAVLVCAYVHRQAPMHGALSTGGLAAQLYVCMPVLSVRLITISYLFTSDSRKSIAGVYDGLPGLVSRPTVHTTY